jgi:hypothetical protein
MSFRDLALPLAARGIPVIPVEPLSKETRLPGGEERGTLDTRQILLWDQENPAYNVGALGTAGGIVVLDCDVKGLVSRIEKETGQKLPPTLTVQSAGKGCAHLYFKQTDVSRQLGNKKGDGLFDLRGRNHYVVGPGSRLPGGEYKIWRDAPIAEFPDWLEGWILANSSSKKTGATGDVDKDSYARLRKAYLENLQPEDMFGLPELTIESLHPTLHSLACLLHDGVRTADDVADILEKIATEYGHREARGRHEIDGIVEHAFKKKPAELTLDEYHPALKAAYADGLKMFATEEEYNKHRETSWRSLFHSKAYLENQPPIRFAINGFLQEEGITMLGGLPGHGKTLVALAMVRALLEGSPLFGYFEVPRPSERVIYLIPESGPSPWAARLKTFRVMDYNDDRLFTQTFSIQNDGPMPLTHPLILEACKGADVFLDTAVRFMEGDENAAAEQKVFAKEPLFPASSRGTHRNRAAPLPKGHRKAGLHVPGEHASRIRRHWSHAVGVLGPSSD